MNKQKRIQKEYKDLLLNPINNITILPDPDNIYIWHYVIFGTEEPYIYGQYYGILTLHEDYPFKAPRIIIKTPHCVGRKCVPVLGYNDGITFNFMNFFLKIKKI